VGVGGRATGGTAGVGVGAGVSASGTGGGTGAASTTAGTGVSTVAGVGLGTGLASGVGGVVSTVTAVEVRELVLVVVSIVGWEVDSSVPQLRIKADKVIEINGLIVPPVWLIHLTDQTFPNSPRRPFMISFLRKTASSSVK
jgi:hypothetical protein